MLSCAPTKRIAGDEVLYNKAKIKLDKKKLDKAKVTRYERISPNNRILGVRFHLFLFNLANPEKEKFPHTWLRKIGEKPVIYDSALVRQNKINFTKFISDKGYNQVNVELVKQRKGERKINVLYNIDLGEPTMINSLNYELEDTSISSYLYQDTVFSLVKSGMPFDKSLMKAERLRIEKLLKNKGYYKFSREYIYYEVANSGKNLVDIKLKIKQNVQGNINPITKIRPHKQYKINSVNIFPNTQSGSSTPRLRQETFNGHNVFYKGKAKLRPSALVAPNRLMPGSIYSLKNVERTYVNYSSLGLFRFINVNINDELSDSAYGRLDCNIELSMRKEKRYAVEFVMTNSHKDLGVRGNLTFNNYNLLKGGEQLQISLSGAVESVKNRLKIDNPVQELGVTARFETPKFLLPFSAPEFQRKYSPRTSVQLAFSNQEQPGKYKRNIANASFGYNWKGNAFNKHSIYPIDFYLVDLLSDVDSAYFVDNISGTRLQTSFIDHSILGIRYNFEYSNQTKDQTRNYVYLTSNIESAGLLLSGLNKGFNLGVDTNLLNVPYFQYIRGDIDFRQYIVLTPKDKLVLRLFGGIGLPYGVSQSMPFEKMYWAGGPYSMRAWQERTLGPGSSVDSSANQLGDIRLEANLEYRFKMFWKLEGALFVDAGNIWFLPNNRKNEESFFIDKFYKDIAIGAGFGTRFDFSYFVIRFDFGIRVRDPRMQTNPGTPDNPVNSALVGSKWFYKNGPLKWDDITFQFGIGYPF